MPSTPPPGAGFDASIAEPGEVVAREVSAGLLRCGAVLAVTGAEAMQAFDVLVMPSRYEAMSYVMLEAAAAGLPMILADVGGASTVLSHGENGFLIANSDNPSELANAMVKSIEPHVLLPMRTAAADRKHHYSLDKMVGQTEALYRRMTC